MIVPSFLDSELTYNLRSDPLATPILDDSGSEIDFQFFGLVDGFEKELGYFNLSEL